MLYSRFLRVYRWPLLRLKRYLMTPYMSCPQHLKVNVVEAC